MTGWRVSLMESFSKSEINFSNRCRLYASYYTKWSRYDRAYLQHSHNAISWAGIPNNTPPKSYIIMLSYTQYAWEFLVNALWDTLEQAVLLYTYIDSPWHDGLLFIYSHIPGVVSKLYIDLTVTRPPASYQDIPSMSSTISYKILLSTPRCWYLCYGCSI